MSAGISLWWTAGPLNVKTGPQLTICLPSWHQTTFYYQAAAVVANWTMQAPTTFTRHRFNPWPLKPRTNVTTQTQLTAHRQLNLKYAIWKQVYTFFFFVTINIPADIMFFGKASSKKNISKSYRILISSNTEFLLESQNLKELTRKIRPIWSHWLVNDWMAA